MKKHDIAELAVMLTGMFFLVQTLPFLVTAVFSGEILDRPASVIPAAVLVLVGLAFIVSAGRVAGLIILRDPDAALPAGLTFTDWQTLFISVIGVLTFVRGAGSLGSYVATYAQYARVNGISRWALFVSPALQIALGAVLFIRAGSLSDWWMSKQKRSSMESAGRA